MTPDKGAGPAQPVVITVGDISDNSGVYVARQNVVFGISSHKKVNSGLGSVGDGNLLYRNAFVVYDPDWIDTPIDDRDVNIYQNQTSERAGTGPNVTQVGFDTINVATLSTNSGIFVGDVKITGLDAHGKTNNAQGSTDGNRNLQMQNLNYIFDADAVDAPIDDRDVKLLSR
ncbi:MAG: hypothetical protein K6T78_14045 [Alicyclobacillus sp.]|nr:hypothetical protein [Alicyclobacillus sp.]